jgi:nucleoside-triphosphatase THEP1
VSATAGALCLGAALAGFIYSVTHTYEGAIVTAGFVVVALTGLALALVAAYYRARANDLDESLTATVDELGRLKLELQLMHVQAQLKESRESITAVLAAVEARSKRPWLPWKR